MEERPSRLVKFITSAITATMQVSGTFGATTILDAVVLLAGGALIDGICVVRRVSLDSSGYKET